MAPRAASAWTVEYQVYQKVVSDILYPLLALRRGSRELAILKELRKSERLSRDHLRDLRLRRLREVLLHADHHVAFFRDRFRAAGFDPATLRDFDDLAVIPPLTKADIQANRERLISNQFQRSDLIENRTGGSTGAPIVFYHERERWEQRQAATLRHNLWAGYRRGDKTALIWGHQTDLSALNSVKARLRNTLIDRQLILDSSDLSDVRLREFVGRYLRFRPSVILAYANSLALVVNFLKASQIELPPPRTIITSAEVLTSENRELIEGHFGVKVFDRYGSRETSVIASECSAHNGLHIGADYLHLEFVAGGKTVAPGESGEILVTVLGNLAFPFIRYQIGDVGAAAPEEECPCGVTLPKMKMVAGRTTDFLLAPDGRRVSGAALTIYLAAQVPGIRQAQIVQCVRDRLEFNLVTGPDFTEESRQLVREKVRHFFGADMSIEFHQVPEIPREASGKYRFSICEIKPEPKA